MVSPPPLATSPESGAPPGPQLSPPPPPQPAALPSAQARNRPRGTPRRTIDARLVLERNRDSDMGDHRVAEPVVLGGVVQHAFEPGARPPAGQLERLAEHAELGLQ